MPTIPRHDDPAAVELARTGTPSGGASNDRESGGMIALHPSTETADNLWIRHDNGEARSALHLTLLYIGPDVTWWDERRVDDVRKLARRAARRLEGPVTAQAWAHAEFNPRSDEFEQCAVYLIGKATTPAEANELEREKRRAEARGEKWHTGPRAMPRGLYSDPLQSAHQMLDGDIRDELRDAAVDQHVPYLPHVTAAYSTPVANLEYTGPVVFDTLSLHLAGERWDFPLTDPGPDGYPPDDDE